MAVVNALVMIAFMGQKCPLLQDCGEDAGGFDGCILTSTMLCCGKIYFIINFLFL